MKIGPESGAATSISGSNADSIVVRGEDLSRDLIGTIGFTDYVWLLITGKRADPAQRAMLDATLVAIAEHGPVPSVVAARMTLAAAPEALQGAVAAGLLGCGSVILGSAQAAGVFVSEIVARDAPLPEAARAVIGEYRAERRPVPGYGHPLHKAGDPRASRLFDIARELGIFGSHCAAAHVAEAFMPELVKRPLAMNVSVAIPAVLLDAGFPLLAIKGVPILARTAGLVAHLVEEQAMPIGFHMAEAASASVSYSGPSPAGFVAERH